MSNPAGDGTRSEFKGGLALRRRQGAPSFIHSGAIRFFGGFEDLTPRAIKIWRPPCTTGAEMEVWELSSD